MVQIITPMLSYTLMHILMNTYVDILAQVCYNKHGKIYNYI